MRKGKFGINFVICLVGIMIVMNIGGCLGSMLGPNDAVVAGKLTPIDDPEAQGQPTAEQVNPCCQGNMQEGLTINPDSVSNGNTYIKGSLSSSSTTELSSNGLVFTSSGGAKFDISGGTFYTSGIYQLPGSITITSSGIISSLKPSTTGAAIGITGMQAGGGGCDEGDGRGGGKGSLTSGADALFSAFLSAWQSISGFLATIKAPQGQSGTLPTLAVKDEGTTTVSGSGSTINTEYSNGGGIAGGTSSGKTVSASQEDKTKSGTTEFSGSSTGIKMASTNSEVGLYEVSTNGITSNVGDVATVHTSDIKTEIVYDTTAGEPAASSDTRATAMSSLGSGTTAAATKDITGNAISGIMPGDTGQHAWFIEHDIDLAGEKISVEIFKPFNEINAQGSVLSVVDKDSRFDFNGQRIYYNRLPAENKYFINKVTNGLDKDNYFRVLQGGENGNYLIDSSKRATVGDEVVEHPTLKGIYIAKERQQMFKKAAEG